MSVLSRSDLSFPPARIPGRRRKRLLLALLVVAVLTVIASVAGYVAIGRLHDDSRRQYLGQDGWPAHGQAAYLLGYAPLQHHADTRAVPIASVAKVMTAVLVLRAAPLAPGGQGFRLRVTQADVADLAVRRGRDESVVTVTRGEVLSERDALAALLLPSANNVAVMLARHTAGSLPVFVARMNALARTLGMTHTTYTDPSGFDASTVSTAGDQVRLATVAMRLPTFANLVALPSYRLPVAGTVHNTDTLLGRDGFVGVKTGSMDAAGGCFVFRVVRRVDGRRTVLTGVVLGQPGHNLVDAGLYAARQLADRVLQPR